jgi:hypothetical protein
MPRYFLAVATGFPRWSGMVARLVRLAELGKCPKISDAEPP